MNACFLCLCIVLYCSHVCVAVHGAPRPGYSLRSSTLPTSATHRDLNVSSYQGPGPGSDVDSLLRSSTLPTSATNRELNVSSSQGPGPEPDTDSLRSCTLPTSATHLNVSSCQGPRPGHNSLHSSYVAQSRVK